MKTKKTILIYATAVLIGFGGSSLLGESDQSVDSEEPSREMILPEGVSAPQVVRLLRMSDEELASLRSAVEFVESLDEQERQEMRRTIAEMRRSEVSGQGQAERGTPGQARGPLRAEWQNFRETFEQEGASLEDLPPAERRALFREHLRQQGQSGRPETRAGQRPHAGEDRPRGGPRQGGRE